MITNMMFDMRCAGSLFTVGRVYSFPLEIHLFNRQCYEQLAGRASLQKLFQS